MSDANLLYWDSDFEIVLELIETHPDINLEEIGLEQLYEWVIALPNFADDPALANERILKDILIQWYEATNDG
jgi:FeS assembly protein IscX